jgi:hypothetical protein
MSTEVQLTTTEWRAVSSVSCNYQLQTGDKAYVLSSTTQPDVSDTGIIIGMDEIHSFTPTSGNILWAKPYYITTSSAVIKVTAQFSGLATTSAGSSTSSSNVSLAFRDAMEVYPNPSTWSASVATGDIIMKRGNTAGAGWVEISKSPFTENTLTSLELVPRVRMPAKINTMISMTHRNAGQQLFLTQMVSDDVTPLAPLAPVAILNANQSGSAITINFANAPDVPFRVGQTVSIRGFVDTRLNVNSAVISGIFSTTSIWIVGNDYTLTSTTINATNGNGTAFIERMDMLANAYNGLSCVRSNTNNSQARFYVREEGSLAKPSGNVAGNHSIGVGSDSSSPLTYSPYTEAFSVPVESIFLASSDGIIAADRTPDANSSLSPRFRQSQTSPDPDLAYRLRFEVRNTEAPTRPVAKIVSIVKSSSATATVTTADPHNLTTGQSVGIYGVYDQTNFTNTNNIMCTVIDANTFTVTLGSSATATSYGGMVILTQGQQQLGGLVPQAVQNVNRTGNIVTVSCNTGVTVALVGNLVELYGFRNSSNGGDVGIDGTYVVRSLGGNVLILEPVAGRAPTGADITSTASGGVVIQRLGVRIHGVVITDYNPVLIESSTKGSGDVGDALPVNVANTVSIISYNTSAVAGPTGVNNPAPNPVSVGGRASNTNITAMSTAGNLVAQLMTMIGVSVVKPYCLPEMAWQYTGALTATTDVVAMPAAGTGIKNHVTQIQVTNTGSSVNNLNIKDGATVKLSIAVPPGQSIVMPIDAGITPTANTPLNVSLSASGTMQVNIIGYLAP